MDNIIKKDLIFNVIKDEFGEEKAIKVVDNMDYYKEKVIENQNAKELNSQLQLIINSNKQSLINVLTRGEYFNNKSSYYKSNKYGMLVFEDMSSLEEYVTNIDYEKFKTFANEEIDKLAEIFIYVDTSEIDTIKNIERMYKIEELFSI